MCAILDANVVHQVFGSNRPAAGRGFLDWLNGKDGRLVVGGKLRRELNTSSPVFKDWSIQALRSGTLRRVKDDDVESRTRNIRDSGGCRSDDPHVIALAQVSDARLLYSNDTDLHRDFTNKRLIDKPRGKVYSTIEDGGFAGVHERLLRTSGRCRHDG